MTLPNHLRRRLGTPCILALYALFALLMTWPLALHLTDSVVGDLESDVWKHVWGFWWVKQCLLDRHVLPLYTSLLNYPYGGSLFFIDPLGSMMATPLQLFMPAATAYNLLVIFNLWLAAAGAYFLARYFTRSTPAAFVAGVAFGFSPYMLANITSGISESFNVGWVPIFLLFYVRTLREPATSNAIWAGVFLAMATVGCWYYGVFCVVFAALFTACHLVDGWRRGGPRSRWGPLPWRRMLAAASALGLVIATFRILELDPRDLAFWYWMGIAGVTLLAVLLLGAARTPSAPASESTGELLRSLLILVLPLDVALFSGWLLVVLAPRLWPPTDASVVALALSSAASLVLGIHLVMRRLKEDTARRVRRLASMLAALAALGIMAAHTVSRLPGWIAAPAATVDAQAWTAIGWLLVLWLLLRTRLELPSLGAASLGGGLQRLLRCGVLALVGLYFFAPPASSDVNLLIWTSGTLLVYLLDGARHVAAGLWSSLVDRARAMQEESLVQPSAEGLSLFYRTTFKRLMLMSLVAFVLIMPFAYAFKRTLNGELSLVYRVRHQGNVDAHLSADFQNISFLADYVTPGKATARRTYTVDRLTRVSYAGWIVLLLALAGVTWGRGGPLGSGRRRWWWMALSGVAVTFSLGPFLYVTSDVHLHGRFPVYMWMYDWFPFFSQISIPYRFNMVAMLGLGVLGAYALAAWLRARPDWFAGLAALSVSLGMLLEVMLLSPAPYPLPLASTEAPAFTRELASEPGGVGLLDVPVQRYQGQLLPGEYFYYQVLHGKSIPNRVEGEIPIYVTKNRFMAHLFDLEHDWPGYPSQVEAKLREALQELRDYRFKYFVVHDNLLRPGARERIHALLTHFLGPPRSFEDNVHVYSVDGAQASLP